MHEHLKREEREALLQAIENHPVKRIDDILDFRYFLMGKLEIQEDIENAISRYIAKASDCCHDPEKCADLAHRVVVKSFIYAMNIFVFSVGRDKPLKKIGSVPSYVKTIVRNVIIDSYNAEKKRNKNLSLDNKLCEEQVTEASIPINDMQKNVETAELQSSLQQICFSKLQSEILYLRAHNFRNEEIAQILEITLEEVKNENKKIKRKSKKHERELRQLLTA